jgi:8-oxo-dGTP pyrophosphatase MutT (NUDIX family)
MPYPLLTLTDKDIFKNDVEQTQSYKSRLAVKIVVFDQNKKIALVGKKYRLLPGGGVEVGETLIDAAKRECLEELGCDIEIFKEIGATEDFRHKTNRHQETHFLLAQIIGPKGIPTTTQDDEQGIQVEWHTLDDVILLLQKESLHIREANYNFSFNVLIQLAALKELQLAS